MKVTPTRIPDVLVIEPMVHRDERGFFLESWHEERLAAKGVAARFVQDNHSRSVRGTLRGLHYQTGSPQGKLVRVVSGEVYDVAVDLRRSSATFGRWVAEDLTADNHKQLWIPPGFAHGFYVLSKSADLLYKCTTYYDPAQDRALRWDDPDVAINWPLPDGCPPILSAKDASAPPLRDAPTYP
ncbi:MAG TPA: dTDP-4-dehydrorhamnose 3,5-epimerase [Gemmatimonadales bacterium]